KSADNFFRSSTTTKRTGHCFMEHIFKKPTFCDVCNHMIVAKHGLRCKSCKMSLHHKCENGVGQQRCMGKLPKGFRRYYSSPLLIQEQYGCIKEVMPIACGNKVDPVYEALRFGTSLAQKAKRPSGSESPHRHSVRALLSFYNRGFSPTSHGPRKDLISIFVCSLSFSSRCRAGDRILLADDSNDDWWKGVIEDRIGFFPAAFAHQLQTGDQVFRCNRTFIGCKEQGQITLKEGEICVSKECEHSGFIIVSSGKKKGFVPCDVLEIL
uniref:SH3 and cysteine rich domain n=1 Tax=Gouania willdenowi TaxID=441366 RepID=A0A8C5GWY7_GOUWI